MNFFRQSKIKVFLPKRSATAFTLVEILVTIVIIGILVGLVAPGVKQMMDKGKSATCLGNVRTYGLATLSCIAENQGFPPGDILTQQWLIPEYIPRPLYCPTKPAKFTTAGRFCYGINAGLAKNYPKALSIPVPSSRIVLVSEMWYWESFESGKNLNQTIWGNSSGEVGSEGVTRPPQYHGSKEARGLNMFFLDGHAQLVPSVGNDWKKPSPVYGDGKNDGYFYDAAQFGLMKAGKLSAP